MPLLDQQFIRKNILSVGNTCTVTQIAVTVGSDEYRTISEVETSNTSIPCFVHVLSYEDEMVKQGQARAGDLIFWFDYSYNSIFSPTGDNKVRITWNGDDYEVDNIKPYKAEGDVILLIEVVVKQI